jgi:chemotaxis methyl-accepting protein methylase
VPVTSEQFSLVSQLVRRQSAIVLDPGKEYLVESRLSALARQEGIDSLDDLLLMLEQDPVFNSLHAKVVDFQELNLLEPWSFGGRFDIVFIRNVLIYFDLPTKQQLLGRIRDILKPDGYLILGSAETTFNVSPLYVSERIGNATVSRLIKAA